MGRFSPTVAPTWGDAFSHALGASVNAYTQSRRMKQEDEMSMLGHGLMPVDPNAPHPAPTSGPSLTPAPPGSGRAEVNANIARQLPVLGQPQGGGVTPQAVGQALPRGPQGLPGLQQTPQGQPQPSPELLARALGDHVMSGVPLQSPKAQQAPMHLLGRDWQMTPQAEAQMTLARALQQAEIGQKNATAHKDMREADQLRLGDAGYAEGMGAVSGAQAQAQVAPHVAEAGGKSRAELPAKLVAQNNESANTMGRERELIPLRAKATTDEIVARQGLTPLHQDEAYAAQHLGRIASSLPTIEAATAPSAWQKIAQHHMLGNYTLTPEGQQYNAAVDRAALSVAVMLEGPRGATPQRVAIVKDTYFPKPGDDDSTVKAKTTQLRELVRDGARKAGRGYERMDPRSKASVDHYINGDAETTPATTTPHAPGTFSFGGVTYKTP